MTRRPVVAIAVIVVALLGACAGCGEDDGTTVRDIDSSDVRSE